MYEKFVIGPRKPSSPIYGPDNSVFGKFTFQNARGFTPKRSNFFQLNKYTYICTFYFRRFIFIFLFFFCNIAIYMYITTNIAAPVAR